MNDRNDNNSLIRIPIACMLAWLIPGLGHIYLGHRLRGIIFLVVLTLTFWTGVAIGGVKSVGPTRPVHQAPDSSKPKSKRSVWFMGQILTGAHALTAYAWSKRVSTIGPDGRLRYLAWPSGEIGALYTGVAGLLNLLIILDCLARAEGLSVFGRLPVGGRMTTGPTGERRPPP